ncbi:hypothetical protein SAV14893_096400 [Streptomyces avermitilis]|uniref:Uncharacterized protein n=1 Tax=Streptomyces avermitilis TaxID=33903 RepID=A0A4D4MG05_STRAX|nr:hypothetical protein SAV14893_096400 [Streptomyces avermitilis]GDY80555.1 hypothetical protein SAV31267_100400 [Streptomyces avermitilis]
MSASYFALAHPHIGRLVVTSSRRPSRAEYGQPPVQPTTAVAAALRKSAAPVQGAATEGNARHIGNFCTVVGPVED